MRLHLLILVSIQVHRQGFPTQPNQNSESLILQGSHCGFECDEHLHLWKDFKLYICISLATSPEAT